MKHLNFYILICGLFFLAFPTAGYCSVESTLSAMQSKLITTILPMASILGLIYAGISFAWGSANARNHLFLAMVGAVVGFGAPSIIAFIQSLVH